jgi:hypothetical protein
MEIKERLIYKCLVGSQAYGTNLPTSDIDYKGIYIQDPIDILGFKYKEQVNINKDESYYEIRRFIELASSANPTILEMLFMHNTGIIYKYPVMNILFENKHKFITKRCFQSFGGYAVAQIKKAQGLNKKMNWEDARIERKTPIDFCYVLNGYKSFPLKEYLESNDYLQEFCGLCAITHFPNTYALYYDYPAHYGKETNTPEKYPIIGYKGIAFEDSNDIRLSSIPKEYADDVICTVYYNKGAYSIHCKEYNDYQTWLKNRNTERYVDVKNHNQRIDGKNLMHCIRLLDCALEIAKTGEFNVYRKDDINKLLSIRKGEVNLKTILEEAELKLEELNKYEKISILPNELDLEFSHNLLTEIRYGFDRI